MKSSVRYIGLFLAAVITAGLPACNNKLDVKPSTGIVPGQIKTAQDVEAALIGAYTNLQQFDA